jgi:hypothetical protein
VIYIATLLWQEINGAVTGTATTITNHRHKTNDDALQDSNYMIPVPPSGYNYGYGKCFRLYASALSEILSNVKLYGGGVPSAGSGTIGWTGIILCVGDQTSDTYVQATGTPGETGTELTAYNGQVSSKTDLLATYTSGNKKAITLAGGVGSKTGVGAITQNIWVQLRVDSTAGHGLLAPYTLTGVYDLA